MIRWLGVHEFTVREYAIDAYPRFVDTGVPFKRCAVVDTETVGLAATDPVVEIAVRQVAYDPATGDMYGMTDEYTSLRDPGVQIPERITELTGITDADVRGQAIDVDRLRAILDVDLIVAHNAAFDRPRVDALVPTSCAWACSSTMIDWRGHGLPSASLGALCLAHGFYCQAHRALGDVAALLRLLSLRNAETSRRYFAEMLETSRKPVVEVWAWGAAFQAKDALKARGYHWRADERTWTRIVDVADQSAECEWLAGVATPRVTPIDPRRRFAA